MAHPILLADDSATIRRVVEISLAREDFALTAVSHGQAALDAATQLKPRVVLLDARLPDGDGYQWCQRLKANPATAACQVLLLASQQEPLDVQRARQCGADGSVSKPFETQALVDKIRALLAHEAAPAKVQPAPSVPLAPEAALSAPMPHVAPPPMPAPPVAAPPSRPAPVLKKVIPHAPAPATRPATAAARRPPLELAAALDVAVAPLAPAINAIEAPTSAPPAAGPAATEALVQQLAADTIEKIAWEVVPSLAETLLREYIEKMIQERRLQLDKPLDAISGALKRP